MAIARGKKKNHKGEKDAEKKRFPLWAASWVGTTLTVVSGLSFLVVCMLLPLVGQAGVKTEFAAQNRVSFAAFCIFSLVLSLLAIGSKLSRRYIDGSPPPMSSIVLAILSTLLLIALFTTVITV